MGWLLYNIFRMLQHYYWKHHYDLYRKKYDISPSFLFNGYGTYLYGKGKIMLGKNSYVGRNCCIQSSEPSSVTVGDNTRISHNVMIYTNNNKQGSVKIGSNTWICANVFIKENVTIGNDSIVGANSVVTKNVPDGEVWAGCPAKKIR